MKIKPYATRITHHATLFLFLLILSTITLSAYASFERLSLNPRISAMGEASTCSFNACRSPAVIPPSKYVFSAVYSQPYSISEIAESQFTYAQRLFKNTHLALSWHRLSLARYKEDLFSFSLGYSIADWSAGLGVNRFRLSIEDFGDCSKFGFDFGLHWRINENWQAGLTFNELNQPELPHQLPRKLSGGIAVKASPELLICAELRKLSDRKLQVRIGGEYELYRNFLIRAGVSNRPWQTSAGLGIRFMSCEIDYTWLNHPALQATHQISVNIFSVGAFMEEESD